MAVGTFSGVVSASGIGLVPGVSTGGVPAANAAALQAALGSDSTGLDKPITIQFTSSDPYFFDTTSVVIPCERQITFDLCGSAYLYAASSLTPLFTCRLQNDNGWYESQFVVKGGGRIGGNAAFLVSDNSGALDPRWAKVTLEDILFNGGARAIDIRMAYTGDVNITRCRFSGVGQPGAIKWMSGRVESHSTSIMVINRCHFVGSENRLYPALHMDGHRGLVLRENTFEGNTGFAGGADRTATNNTIGVYIENHGFYDTVFDHNWWEYTEAEAWGVMKTWTVENKFISGGVSTPRNIKVRSEQSFRFAVKSIEGSTSPFIVRFIQPAANIDFTKCDISGNVQCIVQDNDNLGGYGYLASSYVQPAKVMPVGVGMVDESSGAIGYTKAPPIQIYNYFGGTGSDGRGITRRSDLNANVFPHVHPTYGHCLLIRRLYDHIFELPAGRQLTAGQQFFAGLRMSSPHHIRQGGDSSGIRFDFAPTGSGIRTRSYPDGYAPVEFYFTAPVQSGCESWLMSGGNWFDTAVSGGTYGIPANPWIAVYGLTICQGDFAAIPCSFGPTQSWEWVAGGGPPAGTYALGDTVYGQSRHLICSRPGTSRTISFVSNQTANSPTLTSPTGVANLHEGDWIQNTRNEEAMILSIATDGTITLDRNMKASVTGISFHNYNPLWKVL